MIYLLTNLLYTSVIFQPEEMTHNWPREHHLVTKGAVEVLILEKPVSV